MKDYLYIKVGAICGSILLIFILEIGCINLAEELSALMLFLTFLAILWYSKETQDLKEVSIKRPIMFFNKYLRNGDEEIVLKNYGEGVARNVQIIINNKIMHEIPLVSSIYSNSSSPLSFSVEDKIQLRLCKDEIIIRYYDIGGKTRYTTITQWDDSVENRDKCKIIEYKWE